MGVFEPHGPRYHACMSLAGTHDLPLLSRYQFCHSAMPRFYSMERFTWQTIRHKTYLLMLYITPTFDQPLFDPQIETNVPSAPIVYHL